ncbi:hypothetical protein I302_105935 [Kwoniella bestiolae CBS 10118]|uniref:FAD-binding domain-containing protein n=1 Tax=Kwoniella bestiolae CBS 10118 TaxID=1296100 RepID=A0AAJ8KAT9_9TREE
MPDKARIAIIGAGPGGISLALALQQKGINDFVIYERESGVGGVWYQNRYPWVVVSKQNAWSFLSTHFTILTLDSLIIGAKAIHLER